MAFTWRKIDKHTKILFKELNDLRYAADFLQDNAANIAMHTENADLFADQVGEDVAVDTSVQTGNDAAQDNGDEGAEQSGDQVSQDSAQQINLGAELVGNDGAEQAGQDSAELLGNDGAQQAGQDSAENPSNDAAQCAGQDSAENPSNDASELGGNDGAQKANLGSEDAQNTGVNANQSGLNAYNGNRTNQTNSDRRMKNNIKYL